MLHCSEYAVASGCCRMECRGAQRCSSRALKVSDYRQASVQFESSADGECGGWLGCSNCTIAQLPKPQRASRKSGADWG